MMNICDFEKSAELTYFQIKCMISQKSIPIFEISDPKLVKTTL